MLTRSTSVNSSCTDLYERNLSDISGANGPAVRHFQWKREKREERVEESSGSSPQIPLRLPHNQSLSKAILCLPALLSIEAEMNLSKICTSSGNSSVHLLCLLASRCMLPSCHTVKVEKSRMIQSLGTVQCLGELDNFTANPHFQIWTSRGPSLKPSLISVLFFRTLMSATVISTPPSLFSKACSHV